MKYKDYYKVMDVEKDATQDEIKRAYRRLARKYHPDVSKETDAEERFKEVGEAYEVLKDPEKRAAYDQVGAGYKSGQDFSPPPGWAEGFEFHGGDFTGADTAHFSDFFESLFGRGGFGPGFARQSRQAFRARGEDVYASIEIGIEDAYEGATRSLTLQDTEIAADGAPKNRQRTFRVRIPKGVRPGQHIRLAGQGGAGFGGGERGDLFLEVHFKPHSLYKVEGGDVFIDLPVAPWEAALGATVKVPTPTGTVDLKVPANSSGGRKLRLKGKGLPGASPGDMYVNLKIVLPKADSETAKTAYRQFQGALDFDARAGFGG